MFRQLLALLAVVIAVADASLTVADENAMNHRTNKWFLRTQTAVLGECTNARRGASTAQIQSAITARIQNNEKIEKTGYAWTVTVIPLTASIPAKPLLGKDDQFYAADCDGNRVRVYGVPTRSA
ncbi:uncharacterized protein LOC129592732 [Paramacrobiotus metropolitanus]|uniref:uncharacterized protein LOC129592732 n=1 Tax=Paramacrobiotus metropolitanus TaxID=2943436 RepID=UPI002445C79A|nr:uncharacterized protein LOC129592732 [Paramacrobiotus metropolitanus]